MAKIKIDLESQKLLQDFLKEIKIIGQNENIDFDNYNNLLKIIQNGGYLAFRYAVKKNRIDIFDIIVQLTKLDSNILTQMIRADNYFVLRCAAKNNYSQLIKKLLEIVPIKTKREISDSDNHNKFKFLIKSVNNLLYKFSIDVREEMIKANNYYAFICIAKNGDLENLNKILDFSSLETKKEMASTEDYSAIKSAAINSHSKIVNRLFEIDSDLKEKMIRSNNHCMLMRAVNKNNLEIVKTILYASSDIKYEELASFTIHDSNILYHHHRALKLAIEKNNVEIVNILFDKRPEIQYQLIKCNQYELFTHTAIHGKLEIVDMLLRIAPDLEMEMIKTLNFDAFRKAAENGHLNIIDRLLEIVSFELRIEMIKVSNYRIFAVAAQNGHLDVIDRLLEITPPESHMEMIKADEYLALRWAAKNGHFNIIDRILKITPPESHMEIIKAKYCEAFRFSLENGHCKVVNRLLEIISINDINSLINHSFEHAILYGHFDTFALVAAKLNDINKIKEILKYIYFGPSEERSFHLAPDHPFSLKIKSYKSHPKLIIELGLIDKNLLQQNWENIEKISKVVKTILSFNKVSKNFMNMGFINEELDCLNIMEHIIDYVVESEYGFTKKQRKRIYKTIRSERELVDNKYTSIAETEIGFKRKLLSERNNEPNKSI